ncbi:hypothetical protein FRB94_006096 [Tulasnella sp. JGI-2019a]|nr:hypothetical protein FRB93_013249 [Tulasnella sp. JGI-2019a]KAG8999584.1 hypothetical protein FRB94_006096 [Tulasnella sp. JGI-2019a]
MLKMRTEAALRQKANGGVSEITMLERLEVRANVFTVEEFEDIRAVLGDAAVIGPAAWDEA